ncbi:hypothetical protein HFN01_32165 [Rhizobium leguminosarum]|uniref:hypothetical protein n=1 Tax=Rhizobium leguminosarum TaxID=384 RepID=UPI001C9544F7|nr:hypothetical protein [Rhizobium leguminosarum]MBY5399460.1 hypothetical protein [Rhizobium leguminosarum]
MRLVFIHGMRQEGLDPDLLRNNWTKSLVDKWHELKLTPTDVSPEMPFYGDVLDKLTALQREGSSIRIRGGESLNAEQSRLLSEMAGRLGIGDDEVRAEVGSEIVARGPLNSEYAQALVRLLDRKVPAFGRYGLKFVVQVEAYLRRPHVREAVDEIVEPFLKGGPAVVVAHSLGTIVAYRLLTELKAPRVPLFLTVGSPLGFGVVKENIAPPKLGIPEQVEKWINGTDDRDYVATFASLDSSTFCDGIENWTDIHNRTDDAHYIGDYLSDEKVARAIHRALQ